MLTNIEIGSRIKMIREEKKMTLQEVAEKIGVAKSTIQRYEAGTIAKIKLPIISAIANTLDVNPSWIIGKVEERNVNMKADYILHDSYYDLVIEMQSKKVPAEDLKRFWEYYKLFNKIK